MGAWQFGHEIGSASESSNSSFVGVASRHAVGREVMGCCVCGRSGFSPDRSDPLSSLGARAPGVSVLGFGVSTSPLEGVGSSVFFALAGAAGTIISRWHFGHLTGLPNRSSHAENCLSQCLQLTRIGMFGEPSSPHRPLPRARTGDGTSCPGRQGPQRTNLMAGAAAQTRLCLKKLFPLPNPLRQAGEGTNGAAARAVLFGFETKPSPAAGLHRRPSPPHRLQALADLPTTRSPA